MVTVAALVVTVTIMSACGSDDTGAALAPAGLAPSQVAPMPGAKKIAQLATSAPVRLQIAAIGVDSRLMQLALREDETMQIPPTGFPAGWFTGGPAPGELGPAVIAGHVDWKGPGVFYDLHKLRLGDQISITRQDGRKPLFRVTRVGHFPKDRFPTNLVYGDLDHPGLRLITCGGSFNVQSGHYEANIIVFADLVTAAG